MVDVATFADESGLEVINFQDGAEFAIRESAPRIAQQMLALQRLTRAFVEYPDTILQELVDAAVKLCGADSAGISLEREDGTDEQFYHWAATAGEYSSFLDAMLPRYPSACGICLERGEPQRFRVNQKFFDILGVQAPLVTDGLLLPWQVGSTRGTIFVMAHTRRTAFSMEDCRTMTMLADFAAMAVRHQRQQIEIVKQTHLTAGMAMANELAHRINNPLQGLTNLLYLAANGGDQRSAEALAQELSPMLDRLSTLVTTLLALPVNSAHKG